ASIVPRAQVGNWLYGVACNTARKAKAMNSRRRVNERRAGAGPRPDGPHERRQQLPALLGPGMRHPPAKYRTPPFLCDREGRSTRGAARQLGCPQGTVAGRLTRGRDLLARRLVRHGSTLVGGVVVAALSQPPATAAVPGPLLSSTVKAASLYAAGKG